MKNKNAQQKNNFDKKITLLSITKKISGPVLWTTLVVIGLWSLMHFSSPETKLEPYTNFKKASSSFESNLDTTIEPRIERFADNSQLDFSDMATPTSSPKPKSNQLSRKTLEHIQKGMQLIEAGKYNSADMEFQKAADISPNSAEVFALWGTAHRVQKKYKGANRHFAKALELAPNDAEIAFNWGISRFGEKATDEAIKLFHKTVELSPSYFMGWYYLGKAYGQKENFDEEIKHLLKVTELKPDFGWGHFDLAIVLSLKKRFEEAAPYFEKAIAIDKKQFEKPFVVQFLTALGRYNPDSSKKEKNKKTKPLTKETKLSSPLSEKSKTKEKKSEGSDHKMDEGSKMKKATTNVRGSMLINGLAPGADAILFLETKTKMKAPNQKTLRITIEQKGLQFVPKHNVIPVGSVVEFSNHDREVHNVYSKSISNQFNLGAMSAGMTKTISFHQAGPIVLRCNLHKDMVGTLFIVPNGYYTRPNEQGEYEFKAVKSAEYIMQAWAPHLAPSDVEANLISAELNGEDKTFNFNIKTTSLPGEVHDMVDPTDYKAIVDNIDRELKLAIKAWEAGKKYVSRKRALMATTKYFAGGGLKGALEKSFSEKRAQGLEDKLDDIRKMISGIGVEAKSVTENSLREKAAFIVAQLRVNVQELEARLNPDPIKLK